MTLQRHGHPARTVASQAIAAGPLQHITALQVITKGEIGGAQTHVQTLCDALQGDIAFHAAIGGKDSQSPLATALARLAVPVHRIPALDNSLAPWQLYQAVRQLAQVIRAVRPTLLHAHSSVAGLVARLAGAITGTPVVYTVHGFAFKPGAPALRRAVAWLSECLCAPLTDQLICVSSHEMQWARWLPIARHRCCAIPNGMEDSPHRADPQASPPRLIMVARMAAPKRADLLIQALALLRDQSGTECASTLVGDGPDLPRLRALARHAGLQAVNFTGSRSDVAQLLADHSVFVLLSNHEGMPISIIEAMRAGLPVVASDLPGVRELLPAPTDGMLVPNQVPAIANALAQVLQQPSLRANLGHTARTRYEQAHTPQLMAHAVLDVYRRVAP